MGEMQKMYLNCNKKNLTRLSKDSFRYIPLEFIKYPKSNKLTFDVDDVSHFIKGSSTRFFLFLCPYCKTAALFSSAKRVGMKPFNSYERSVC